MEANRVGGPPREPTIVQVTLLFWEAREREGEREGEGSSNKLYA